MIKDLISKLNMVLKFSTENFKSTNVKGSEDKVEYAKAEAGIEVHVSGANGSELAKDGEYLLENGDHFEVKDGKISKVIATETVEKVKVKEEVKEEENENKQDDSVDSTSGDSKVVTGESSDEEGREEVEVKEEEVVEIIIEEVKEKEADKEALEAEIEALKKELEDLKSKFSKLPTAEDLQKFSKDFIAELKKTPATQEFNKVEVKATEEDKWDALTKRFS